MSYIAVRFDADAAAAAAWADTLLEAGALYVDIADPHAGTADEEPRYGEPDTPAEGLWPVSRLTERPTRDTIPIAAQEQLIVELYSK